MKPTASFSLLANSQDANGRITELPSNITETDRYRDRAEPGEGAKSGRGAETDEAPEMGGVPETGGVPEMGREPTTGGGPEVSNRTECGRPRSKEHHAALSSQELPSSVIMGRISPLRCNERRRP